jgi:hypothetical protein
MLSLTSLTPKVAKTNIGNSYPNLEEKVSVVDTSDVKVI